VIFNLESYPTDVSIERTCKVCIFGGGTAGLFLAQSLKDSGINVIVIELGGTSTRDADSSFKTPSFTNQIYRGALKGRVSGLGGTSSKWGGQMIGLRESDFNLHDGVPDQVAWPVSKQQLRPFYKKVANTLGFDNPSFSFKKTKAFHIFDKSLLSDWFDIRISTWIPFRKRNFSRAFGKTLSKKENIEIWTNAKLSSFKNAVWEENRLSELTLCGPNGQALVVTSDYFVLTLGAIETTKYVSQIMALRGIHHPFESPFCDHISSSVGYLRVRDKKAFLNTFSPFFVKNIMKTIRFEFRYEAQVTNQMASAFVHFVTQQKKGSTLDIIRTFARKLQGESVTIRLRDVDYKMLAKDLISIIFWRIFRGKLILNHGGTIEVLVDVEQRPEKENRICVQGDDVSIDWNVTRSDRQAINNVSASFRDHWNNSPELSAMGIVELEDNTNLINYYDVYHPTGSLPFGVDEDTSILDPNLRVWCSRNIYVSSTAVFPTGGSSNPGFTHLALTQRLAEHLHLKILEADAYSMAS
jgi:choline dehydrogenase-like flavoprotein